MLLLNSCKSCPTKGKVETNNIPAFPSPIINEQIIVEFITVDEQVKFVQLPYWYWLEIVEYAADVEAFAQSF